ncbi:hypothetical protein DMN91_000044 [Ooceraea biroi]|uniref:Hemolymph lipopolysaccharide-binding protein n=1 Tax=Ooceraea biroi TaxID=2015173 RepID=A0A026WJ90_OOCBI|nr:hemolymph lipopolysaccharide-binding protein [Ooceraea biroi]XP_026828817.1 hemolymph lipopolysaccharide-binding protein [Ooceraea biroi]EZA55159.1 Hemolymph lipopolysaccharide-binding protein [Ooceraea biroi]RLU26251.1 hypothetical protein DMN91_000044 [Ooceraea biroi]
MLRYILVVFLYAATCCNAIFVAPADGTDTTINLPGKPLNGVNGNLPSPQKIIYVYGLQWNMQNAVNLIEKGRNDYLVTPGMSAHKLHVRKVTWNKARRVCLQEGGHLAVINSNSEEKILLRILEENKVNQAWLGVHDLYEEGDWNTIMDEPMEASGYSKWTSKIANLPDNYNGKQHCGILTKDGGMDDIECTSTQAFFCEISF